jgi:Secretion system C-terminal sorting domain
MKNLFTLVTLFYLSLIDLNAQSAVSACQKEDGSINIMFDYSKNCEMIDPAKKDTLGTRLAIGFYSGANDWSSTVSFDAPDALRATRMAGTSGNTSKFEVNIANPKEYYGVGDNLVDIKFVFNDGISNPNDPWVAEGREHNSGCTEFVVTIASLATCVVSSSQDLRKEISVKTAPNPFSDRTFIQFNNPDNKPYSLNIVNMTGQSVRTINNITTNHVEIQRENLSSGIYYAVLKNTEGKFLTEKLVVQ